MIETSFYEYAKKFGTYQCRSMFGGIGLFADEAMYALIMDETIYLRGGSELDEGLSGLGCSKFKHVKKQSVVTVNYYDISTLYNTSHPELDNIIEASIKASIQSKKRRKSPEKVRLRDLPNMRFTLERMLVKSGVSNVRELMELGAEEVFDRVQKKYGRDVDNRLLWKLVGAIEGVHWKLICDTTKKR